MGQLTNLYVSESYQGLLKLANSTTGVTGTLQYVQDGNGNNIPMLVSTSSVVITGSFRGDGSGLTGITATVDTGSLVTTSSFNAFTASIDGRVDALEVATGSLQNQINQKLDTGSFNSYTSSNDAKVNALINATGSYATTSSLTSLSQSIAATDLSQDGRLNSIEGVTGSFATTSSLNSYTLTSSFNSYTSSANGRLSSLESATSSLQNQINQKLDTGSFNTYTSSNDAKVNALIGATGSYATTGSNTFYGTQTISGSLNVTGSITALSASITYLQTVYQTSSVIFTSGSNILGDEAGDTQTLYGTIVLPNLNIHSGSTAPHYVTWNDVAQRLEYKDTIPTASYALNATSASWADNSNSASYAQNATSASYSLNSTSASFAQASISSSFSNFAVSSSQAQNAVTASYALNANSASYAISADSASIAYDVVVYGKCNNPGGLTRGTVVRIVGADGNNPLFDSASWEDDNNSANTLGVLSEDVASNAFANVVVQGKLIGINTSGFTAGDLMFLSSSGQYTTQSVPAPYHEVRLGQVLRVNQNQGSMYVNIDNGYELQELHDVDIQSVAVGDVLTYVSGAYGQWVNKTVDELGYLQTSSFNSYTASMDARTGSYITTGSISTTQSITGSLILSGSGTLTGSLNIINGNLEVISNNTTLNPDLYVTNSLAGQSNIIQGWGDNPTAGGAGASQANYTGSLRITGSNNIVSMPQIRATALGGANGLQGYISGSNNWINGNSAGIYLSTSSLLSPKTQGNIVNINSSIQMTFTSSSLTSPMVSNNAVFGGGINLNHPSGSVNASANIVTGQITSTQNFVTNVQANASTNNVLGAVTLNHISSSILFTANYTNAPVTINNHLSSSNITNNSLSVGANLFLGGSGGLGHNIWVSGSQSSNVTRGITDNLIGGRSNIVSSSFVSSSNSNLVGTIIYGSNLLVSGSHVTGNSAGGSAFFGRFNDTGSLALAQDIVFAVGTGTAAATRRTGLYVTSGSLVGISGSLNVIGNSIFTGSAIMSSSTAFPLYVSGTIQTQRLHFDGNPFNTNPSSNLGAIRIDGNNQRLYSTMYNYAEITTQSLIGQYVNTGSNIVDTYMSSSNNGTDATLNLVNSAGTRTLDIVVDKTVITGSVQGNVNALSISSNTASLNLNNGNFFTLQLVSGSATHINPSNIKPGQTVNILLNTTGSGTVTFPSSVKQASGSAYVPTTTTGVDIITMVSFDSTNLYLANVKNLI